MSRFVAPDLSALGDVPQVVPVDFEAIKEGRDAYLVAALAAYGIDYDLTKLETDPLVIAYSEGGGYQETLWRQRVNEAIRGLSLATAIAGDLDHIGATYAGISRLIYPDEDDQPANSQWDAARGKWVEVDSIFRARIVLAFEAFSTAGPEGAYAFHALELDGVRDVADVVVYSEEDAATYSNPVLHADAYSVGLIPAPFTGRDNGEPVLAPEILVVVLPAASYGAADQALLNRVFAACTAEDVRPIGDNVRIEAATVTAYNIEVTLRYAPGADASTMAAEAKRRLEAYAADRRRIGLAIQREVIGGRAAVDNRVTVDVIAPATDIEPGPKGVGQVGTVTVNVVQAEGSWS